MDAEKVKQIALYIMIIGLLIVIVSLIVPWGTIDAKIGSLTFGHVDFYCWGIHSTSGTSSSWSIFLNIDSLKFWFSEEELKDFALVLTFYIAIIPVILMILILGVVTSYAIFNEKYSYNFSVAIGSLAIINLFFFYVFINFGLFSVQSGLLIKPYFNFSTGFYLMLFSSILFFVSYFSTKWFENIVKK